MADDLLLAAAADDDVDECLRLLLEDGADVNITYAVSAAANSAKQKPVRHAFLARCCES